MKKYSIFRIFKFLTSNQIEPVEIKIELDNGIEYVEVHHAPIIMEGEIFAIQIIGREITKRKIAEKDLIESKKNLQI